MLTNQLPENAALLDACDPSYPSGEADCFADPTPARLQHGIRLALRRSGHAELRRVEIDVHGNAIRLNGEVPTFYLKQMAQELARTTAPGFRIENFVRVVSA